MSENKRNRDIWRRRLGFRPKDVSRPSSSAQPSASRDPSVASTHSFLDTKETSLPNTVTSSAPESGSVGDDAPPTPKIAQALWEEALTNLRQSTDKESQRALAFSQRLQETTEDNHRPLDDIERVSHYLDGTIKNQHDTQTRSQARGYYETAVNILNKFLIVGDVGVNFDPVHAALPWAAVRFTITTLTAGIEIDNQMAESIATITSLFARCDLYATLFLATPLATDEAQATLRHLKQAMIDIYTNALKLLACVDRIDGKGQAHKHVTAPYDTVVVGKHLQNLQGSEKSLQQAGADCQSLITTNERNERREKTEKVLEEITRLHAGLQQPIDFLYREKILSALKPVDTAGFDQLDHKEVLVCHEETRVDLLKKIHEWATTNNELPVFWLEGLAGTGKSTISRTVADILHQQGRLAGSFFFKRGEGDRAHGKKFFLTIAHQLAVRFPFMLNHISEVLKDEPDIASKHTLRQFTTLLADPLSKQRTPNNDTTRDLVVVMDALDECDLSDLEVIIPQLTKIRLKYFITSRPDWHIRLLTSRLEGTRLVLLHSLDEAATKKDIRTYLASQLAVINERHTAMGFEDDTGWPDKETLDRLTNLAHPLFIAAATVCRMIGATGSFETPMDIAEDILSSDSGGLEGVEIIYNQVLKKLTPGSGKIFRRIIGPIVVMFDHLNTQCLSELLAIEKMKIQLCVAQLGEVLDISNLEAPIKPFHLSLPDFLLGSSAPQEFQISHRQTHKELAACCNRVLRTRLRKDICEVSAPGFQRSNMSLEQVQGKLAPDLRYACLYWVPHLKASGEAIMDDDGTHRLLKSSFLMWLEALAWLDKWGETMQMLDELQLLTDSRNGTEVLSFLKEGVVFVSQFGSGIQRAPLQVYHAGLVFTPPDSILGQSFSSFKSSRWSAQGSLDDLRHKPSFRTFEGDGRPINVVALSALGILAICTDDSTIQVWDPVPSQLLYQFEWPEEEINAIALGAEGQLAASSKLQIRIWDLKTHRLLRAIDTGVPPDDAPLDLINSGMVFSEPEDLLCVVHDHKRASRYDWRDGRVVDSINLPLVGDGSRPEPEPTPALSRNGRYFAISQGLVIRIFDWETPGGYCQSVREAQEGLRTECMAFSLDCRVLAAATLDTITLWNLESGQKLYEVEVPLILVASAMVFSRTELVIGDVDGVLLIWDTKAPSEPRLALSHGNTVRSLAFASTQGTIASGSADGTVKVWDQLAISSLGQGKLTEPKGLAVGYNSEILFSSEPNEITVWDPQTCAAIQHFERSIFAVSEVVPRIAMSTSSGIEILNTEDWSLEATIPVQGCDFICFSNDGTKVLHFLSERSVEGHGTGSSSEITLFAHDVKTGRCELARSFSLPDFKLRSESVALFVDGLRIRVALGDIRAGCVWVFENDDDDSTVFSVPNRRVGYHPSMLVWLHDATQLLALSGFLEGWVRETKDWSIVCEFPYQDMFAPDLFHPSFFKNTAIPAGDCMPEFRLSALINDYHISHNGEWLMNGIEAVLWLPVQYRPQSSALLGSTLAISTSTGQVWFLKYT